MGTEFTPDLVLTVHVTVVQCTTCMVHVEVVQCTSMVHVEVAHVEVVQCTSTYGSSTFRGVVKGTFGTFCLSSQIFGKCQTFCGAKSAKSAKSAKLLKKVHQFYVQ